jgi:hypothetical protein
VFPVRYELDLYILLIPTASSGSNASDTDYPEAFRFSPSLQKKKKTEKTVPKKRANVPPSTSFPFNYPSIILRFKVTV